MRLQSPESRHNLSWPNHNPDQFSPLDLDPFAWYGAHLGGSATQITDSSANERAALTFGAGSNSPLLLPYVATPYVYTPNVLNNYITGAIIVPTALDVRIHLAMDDWTGTPAFRALLGQRNFATDGWAFALHGGSSGLLWFQYCKAGLNVNVASSWAPSSVVSAGQPLHVRVTFEPNFDSTNDRITFYSSTDGTAWTQRSQTVIAKTLMAPPTRPVQILALGDNSSPVGASLFSASVLDGIGGTELASFDSASCGQAGYGPWTVARGTTGRKTVVLSPVAHSTKSVVLAGTDDYGSGPTAAIPPATASDSCTLWCVIRPWATQAANKVIWSTRLGSGAGVTLRFSGALTVVADVSNGAFTVTTPAVTLVAGTRYVIGVIITGGAPGTAACFANEVLGSSVARSGLLLDETGGALTVFADSTPANFDDLESEVPFASQDSILNSNQRTQLVSFYGGGL